MAVTAHVRQGCRYVKAVVTAFYTGSSKLWQLFNPPTYIRLAPCAISTNHRSLSDYSLPQSLYTNIIIRISDHGAREAHARVEDRYSRRTKKTTCTPSSARSGRSRPKNQFFDAQRVYRPIQDETRRRPDRGQVLEGARWSSDLHRHNLLRLCYQSRPQSMALLRRCLDQATRVKDQHGRVLGTFLQQRNNFRGAQCTPEFIGDAQRGR